MIDFLRLLFESALKTNEHLEFVIMTGCLNISKETPISNGIGVSDSHKIQALGYLLNESIFNRS